jgi:periplasmic divalent cation tolerance protein
MSRRKMILALTTVADDSAAGRLARTLVKERLSACVQRLSISSTYTWNGNVQDGEEVLLLIKSTSDLLDALRERVLALHDYDVPEFVVIEADQVAGAYLEWALAGCGPASDR